jgi:hypothetical protein
METIFLSQSFVSDDRDLVDGIDRLLTNFGLITITGHALGGAMLTPEVMDRIEQSDALVAVVTRRDQLPDGQWTSSDWTRDEFAHAKSKDKPSVALIEGGVRLSGAYLNAAYEHIPFERATLLEPFLRLSDTLRAWRDKYGRVVRVRLQPEQAAALAGGGARCIYRMLNDRGVEREWQDGKVIWEAGGVFVVVRGLRERDLLQVKVEAPGTIWRSPYEPQRIHANLTNSGVGP